MRLLFCIMFLFFYVFNFNAIARENCFEITDGLDRTKRSHLLIPRDQNHTEMYFECGDVEANQLFCNVGQLVAVRGYARIGGELVQNQFVKCAKTESGYEWVRQDDFEKCTGNDVKSINGLNTHEVLFEELENAEMIYVNMSKGSYSSKERATPIDIKKLCFAYMCNSGYFLYNGKCVHELSTRVSSIRAGEDCSPYDLNRYLYATKGKYRYDKNDECMVTECKRGYKPDEKGEKCIEISETDTGSANTGASQSNVGGTNENSSPDTGSANTDDSQSDVGGTNENPSPAFLQAMSELEEINEALDEVMKRLQEEKQVKNDNVT